MTIAGRYFNTKSQKWEIISYTFPIRLYIGCQWCGVMASSKMYLIQTEEDYSKLERHYSALCKCGFEKLRD